jgi:hypothetical protein
MATDEECGPLGCESWGSANLPPTDEPNWNTLINSGYSKWEITMLQKLYFNGGPDATYGVKYITSNNIHIKVGKSSDWQSKCPVGAWYEGNKFVVLTPNKNNGGYEEGVMPDAFGLQNIIHEARHIEQGGFFYAQTAYGEIEAWQIGFRVYQNLGGYISNVMQEIIDLPLSYDPDILTRGVDLMLKHQKDYLGGYLLYLTILPYRFEPYWRYLH